MINIMQRETLLNMVSKTPKNNRGSIKHAWVHIDKARALAGLDNEMAAFRAITAEEEAATAIIRELKDIGYKNSKILNPRNHTHKTGLWHLLTVVSAFMYECGTPLCQDSCRLSFS